jgi:hypothetical protein
MRQSSVLHFLIHDSAVTRHNARSLTSIGSALQ